MKKTLAMLCSAIFMLCLIQGEVNAQQGSVLSPTIPATPATPNGPGEPATPATPATPAVNIRRVGAPQMTAAETELLKNNVLC